MHSDDSINVNLSEESKEEIEYFWKPKAEHIYLNCADMNKQSREGLFMCGWNESLAPDIQILMTVITIIKPAVQRAPCVSSFINICDFFLINK